MNDYESMSDTMKERLIKKNKVKIAALENMIENLRSELKELGED